MFNKVDTSNEYNNKQFEMIGKSVNQDLIYN